MQELYRMTVGSYDERTGNLELEPVRGEPEVLVLSGNGTGTAVYRRLQREGIPFAAGILWENDLDYPSAKALAAEVVSVKAFCRIDEKAMNRAKELIDTCRQVICTMDGQETGEFYQELKELLEYAKRQGK